MVGDQGPRGSDEGEQCETPRPTHGTVNVEHHHREGDADEAVEVGHDPQEYVVHVGVVVEHVFAEHEHGEQAVADRFGKGNDFRDADLAVELCGRAQRRQCLPDLWLFDLHRRSMTPSTRW